MAERLLVLAVAVLALAGRAEAGLFGQDRIELRPPVITVTRTDPLEGVTPRSRHARFEQCSSQVASWAELEALRGPVLLCLPECPPEGLDLEIQYGAFLFKVGAELLDPKAPFVFTPRNDCDTREAYFWVRLQYGFTEHLYLFCESFQAAGAILGSDTLHAVQAYVWDGYQVQFGGRIRLVDGVTVEGGPVLYALSATRQRDGLGGRIGLHLSF